MDLTDVDKCPGGRPRREIAGTGPDQSHPLHLAAPDSDRDRSHSRRARRSSPLPKVSALDQRPIGGHDHDDPAQERATTRCTHERGRIVRDPHMEDEHDREERDVPADDSTDDLAETRGDGVVHQAARPRDRPTPSDDRHRDEDRVRREQGRKDSPEHDAQLRRKKDQPRMNRCQPSHSQSPNRMKRPSATVMKDRKKS
jgi:hypothetical protein